MTTHSDPDLLARFRGGRLDPDGRRRLRAHLAEGCPGCSMAVARLLVEREAEPRGPAVLYPADLVRPYRQEGREVADWEELVAPGLAAVLEAFEEAEAFQVIAAERAYQTAALATYLTDEANRTVIWDMFRAYDLARRAVAVAAHASLGRYGKAVCLDLQGKAAMALANASRCRSRFYEARRAMDMATSFLEQGSGDVLSQARLASLRGSLAADLGYYREALRCLHESWRFSRAADDRAQRAHHQVKCSKVVSYFDPRKAVEISRRALRTIDRETQPWLHLCASHNLCRSLAEAGFIQESCRMLERCASWNRPGAPETYWLLRAWQEGVVLGRLGRFKESLRLLGDLRVELDQRDRGAYLALLHVDLAEIHLLRGREDLAHRHAREASSLFALLGAESHARRALNLLASH